jgi:hypothetical protein
MAFNKDSVNLDLVSQSILKTLAYSDIFDFPLTKEELWKFLICAEKIDIPVFENKLKVLINKKISKIENYFCLKGKEKITERRKKNLSEVNKKIEIAKKAALQLAKIPTIMFIGISGGLAMSDVDKEDDIDFFIVTKKDRLYITRFLVLCILQTLKMRRKRQDENPSNKICVNLLLDEQNIDFPHDKRDIYTAHEIIQLKPVFQRNNTYVRFLDENNWTRKYFINFDKNNQEFNQFLIGEVAGKNLLNLITNNFWEDLTRLIQIAYMKNHRKTETVTKHIIGFHPTDYRVQTLNKLRLKYQELGLLTNL